MGERYTKIFSLPANLYIEGSPVIIAAGALLKDSQIGHTLAQLKFKSISNIGIKSLKVSLSTYDSTGKKSTTDFQYEYPDLLSLTTQRGQEFGSKIPIYLPDENTIYSFSARVMEVTFSDNTLWHGPIADWLSLPPHTTLQDYLPDHALREQFRFEAGMRLEYAPLQIHDLWYCSCGAINHNDEATCYACGRELSFLNEHIRVEGLKERYNTRIVKTEQEKAEKQAEKNTKIQQAKGLFQPKVLPKRDIVPKADEQNQFESANQQTGETPHLAESQETKKANASPNVGQFEEENAKSSQTKPQVCKRNILIAIVVFIVLVILSVKIEFVESVVVLLTLVMVPVSLVLSIIKAVHKKNASARRWLILCLTAVILFFVLFAVDSGKTEPIVGVWNSTFVDFGENSDGIFLDSSDQFYTEFTAYENQTATLHFTYDDDNMDFTWKYNPEKTEAETDCIVYDLLVGDPNDSSSIVCGGCYVDDDFLLIILFGNTWAYERAN